jgi:TolB-like protein
LKSLKTHWITGPLSWLLSAALCLPVWLAVGGAFLAAPRAAQAQTLNRAPLWAVVPFENESGYGQADIGVQASDGFVVELSKTNKYDVVSRSDTQQAISSNGLVEPLDTIGLQQLSRDLDADAVATGTVKTIAFTSNPRRAIVSVVIRVVDKISGELINGAVATGTSTPRAIPDNDDDAQVDQAI